MTKTLMEYFNKQPRLGCLSTSGKDGKVDVACFGSPRMVDEKTVVMSVRKNRTFNNLLDNPNAVFMIMEPGKTSPEWKGVRVYLKMKGYDTSGEKLEKARAQTAKAVGEEAAKAVHAAITFEIDDVRPIVDMGQGWEKSI
ncbi:MAG: pyridoxamine 5-phosphate oxidase [Deltaproteobacteria bacterium RBG_13_53_10]|nr:MAG: pyridoxamine 5-phosphate oxidase [Deltaproteobacteria bacterium RBG_13_53_10]